MLKEKHLGIRIDEELHYKLHYISKYEGRSANGQIMYLIRKCIAEFEKQNGEIQMPIETKAV
jgi:hypothetical protein